MRITEIITEAVKQRLDAKCWTGKHKEGTKIKGGVRVNNCVPNESVEETAAWKRKEGKNKKGGLNAKGVASYRKENPGSKLQTAVTTKPSKLKPGSKDAKRRKSFCARMGGMKGAMKKPNGDPTRKALALRKWNCESVEHMVNMILENMDHSKDNRAVPELKAALLARKSKLQSATEDQVYDIIDQLMSRIAKSHGISGQKLHDMWVDQYDQIPDTWVMKEVSSYQPPAIDVGDEVRVGKFKNRKAEVQGFTKDKNNQPVLRTNKGDQQLFKPRITKLMKDAEVNELFAPGKNWKWSFTGSQEAAAIFTMGDVRYSFNAITHPDDPGKWDLTFQDVDRKRWPQGGEPSKYGLTGTGNSAEVMSTIADIIRSFLEKYHGKIRQLRFSAEEASRKGLYAKMAKRLLPNWILVKSGHNFVLTSPNVEQA